MRKCIACVKCPCYDFTQPADPLRHTAILIKCRTLALDSNGGLLHCLRFSITPPARVRPANFMRVTEVETARDSEVEMKGKKREKSLRESETGTEKGDVGAGCEEWATESWENSSEGESSVKTAERALPSLRDATFCHCWWEWLLCYNTIYSTVHTCSIPDRGRMVMMSHYTPLGSWKEILNRSDCTKSKDMFLVLSQSPSSEIHLSCLKTKLIPLLLFFFPCLLWYQSGIIVLT